MPGGTEVGGLSGARASCGVPGCGASSHGMRGGRFPLSFVVLQSQRLSGATPSRCSSGRHKAVTRSAWIASIMPM